MVFHSVCFPGISMYLVTNRDTLKLWSHSQVSLSVFTFLFCSCASAEDCSGICYSTDCPKTKIHLSSLLSAEVKLQNPSTAPAKAALNLHSF